MFARFQTFRPTDTDVPDAHRGELTDILRRHAGYGGAYYLVSGPSAVRALVTLWSTEEDARLAPDRTRAAAGGGPRPVALDEDTVYEVIDDESGPAAGRDPAVAAIAAFDGPVSDPGRAATDRVHRRHVIPALRSLPGTVRLVILWDRLSRSMRALHLATDPAPLEAARDAVEVTDPAADEDPALVSRPDRVERWEVMASDVPATPLTGASGRP